MPDNIINYEIEKEIVAKKKQVLKERLLILFSSNWIQDPLHMLHSPDRKLIYSRKQIANMSDDEFNKIMKGEKVWVPLVDSHS